MGNETNLDLIKAAAAEAGNALAVCEDLSALLFPKAKRAPSEQLQAAVGGKLHDLVQSIESALLGGTDGFGSSVAWAALTQKGAIQKPEFISFALSRVAEDNVVRRLADQSRGAILQFLPTKLLGHSDTIISDLARDLLAAEQIRLNSRKNVYLQLSPVMLAELVQAVADELDNVRHGKDEPNGCNSRKLLSSYDASRNPSVAAQKLLFGIGSEYGSELRDPLLAGPHLFVAEISRQFTIPHDQVLLMIDAESAAPLMLLMALLGYEKDDAFSKLNMIRGVGRDDWEFQNFPTNSNEIDKQSSNTALDGWRHMGLGAYD